MTRHSPLIAARYRTRIVRRGDVVSVPEMTLVESDEPQVLAELREAEVADAGSSEEEHEVPDDYYFGRYGTFMLIAPKSGPSADRLRDGLEQAIRKDNRIVDAMPLSIKKEWVNRTLVYPMRAATTDQALLSNEGYSGGCVEVQGDHG